MNISDKKNRWNNNRIIQHWCSRPGNKKLIIIIE